EKEIEIDKHKKAIIEKGRTIAAFVTDEERSRKKVLEHCWAQRLAFATFTKITLKNAGSKPNHLSAITKRLENQTDQDLDIASLTGRYQQLYETELNVVIHRVDAKLYLQIRRLEKRLNVLLQQVIVGNEDVPIANLISDLNARSWV